MNEIDNGVQKLDDLIATHWAQFLGNEDASAYLAEPDEPHERQMPSPQLAKKRISHVESTATQLAPPQPTDLRSTNGQLAELELTKDDLTASGLTIKTALALDPYAFKLFMFLNVVTGSHDCCQASLHVLADGAGLARESCRKAIRSLEEKGYMHLVKRDQRKGNIYRVKKVLV